MFSTRFPRFFVLIISLGKWIAIARKSHRNTIADLKIKFLITNRYLLLFRFLPQKWEKLEKFSILFTVFPQRFNSRSKLEILSSFQRYR